MGKILISDQMYSNEQNCIKNLKNFGKSVLGPQELSPCGLPLEIMF